MVVSLSPKTWKNYPRETPIKVPFIARCWRKSQSFASCSLCCLGQPSSLLQFSTKIQGIFAACHEEISSDQGIAPCQGRRSHLTRVIQESVLGCNLTAITNWTGCTNPASLRISVLSLSHTHTNKIIPKLALM